MEENLWSLSPKNCDVDGVLDKNARLLTFNIRRSFLQRDAMTFDDFHPTHQNHALIFQMYLELCHECITYRTTPKQKKKKKNGDDDDDDDDDEIDVDDEIRCVENTDDRIDNFSLFMETVFDRESEVVPSSIFFFS
mgnify:CR=1 FL=1